jgi:hypothetical protein
MEGDHYLAWHNATERYYVGRSESRAYLGRDRDDAIRQCRLWVSKGETVTLTESHPAPKAAQTGLKRIADKVWPDVNAL